MVNEKYKIAAYLYQMLVSREITFLFRMQAINIIKNTFFQYQNLLIMYTRYLSYYHVCLIGNQIHVIYSFVHVKKINSQFKYTFLSCKYFIDWVIAD